MVDAPDSGLSVVFAGGGCKTFWGMGVLRALEGLLPPVDNWAGTSAGSIMALVNVSERVDESLAYFLEITSKNPRNFYAHRALVGEPVFPHDSIVRSTLRFIMDGGGFARIREAAPVHILMSVLRAESPVLRTCINALRQFEQRNRIGRVHGPAAPPPGIDARIVRSIDATGPEQLLEWAVMSASTPPVTPAPCRDGLRYLDGALVDNVPVRALPDQARRGRILVLLSSPFKVARCPLRLPEGGRILYLAPGDELPVTTWDYTSPDNVLATYELGQREGTVLRRRVASLL
ncbi:patatin-like phospholipase family protein [Enhygromyxa salina]|uniref:Patatin-like phospholipase n=1 Tax=Enhygromyxa salina TaxID=215803 RepID=A0A2S9YNX0_9BACT|nr:patatin-like phospholipase family protein [Enhygromyxa salina]PRQ06759.1 Patatin-like phospholipase [Enhygromyxa salina]